jgi:4-hydroxyphenylacetate 3-monooxygenase
MPARTGQQYIEAISAAEITVEIHGERTTGKVAEIPAFKNLIQTYAALYDFQHDPELRDVMTYDSPTTGERVGRSFLQPTTLEDLVRRRLMMEVWARSSNGMLGRTGDYLNAAIMAMAGAADWFAQDDPQYGSNIRNYYEYIREHDLLLTHADHAAGEPLRLSRSRPTRSSPRASSRRTTTAS